MWEIDRPKAPQGPSDFTLCHSQKHPRSLDYMGQTVPKREAIDNWLLRDGLGGEDE
jgi:hypothetical protein